MKKLFLMQIFNPAYLGDHTPNEDPHIYQVEKVINATTPAINDTLTRESVDDLCSSDEWIVTIV